MPSQLSVEEGTRRENVRLAPSQFQLSHMPVGIESGQCRETASRQRRRF